MHAQKLLLLLAALGSVHSLLAQRPAIAPLQPLTVRVAPPLPAGRDIVRRPPDQPAAPAAPAVRSIVPPPVFLLNSRIIVGPGLLNSLLPRDIAPLYVYKGEEGPAQWPGPLTHGIIDLTLKPKAKLRFKTRPLAALGRKLKLRGAVCYQLEGVPLPDLPLRIATADIARLEVQATAGGPVVNIHLVVPPPVIHPPGTILIRGIAGL